MNSEKEEKLEISINEVPDEVGFLVKEQIIELNTHQSNDASSKFAPINGKLVAGIISSNKTAHIILKFVDIPSLIIYENKEFKGTFYLPFRISPVSKTGDEFNYGPQPWFLNESLIIKIKGQKETNVKIRLRYL